MGPALHPQPQVTRRPRLGPEPGSCHLSLVPAGGRDLGACGGWGQGSPPPQLPACDLWPVAVTSVRSWEGRPPPVCWLGLSCWKAVCVVVCEEKGAATEGCGGAQWEVWGTGLGQGSAAGDRWGAGAAGRGARLAQLPGAPRAVPSPRPPLPTRASLGSPGAELCCRYGRDPGANVSVQALRVAVGAHRSVKMRGAFIPFYLIAVYKIVFVYRINCPRTASGLRLCLSTGKVTVRPLGRPRSGAAAGADGEHRPRAGLGARRAATGPGADARAHLRCAAPAPPALRGEAQAAARWSTARPGLRVSHPGPQPPPAPAGNARGGARCPWPGARVSSAQGPRGPPGWPAVAPRGHWGRDRARQGTHSAPPFLPGARVVSEGLAGAPEEPSPCPCSPGLRLQLRLRPGPLRVERTVDFLDPIRSPVGWGRAGDGNSAPPAPPASPQLPT